DVVCGEVVLNRNERSFEAVGYTAENRVLSDRRTYFPLEPLPFAAEVVYLLVHILLWAIVAALAALLLAAVALPLQLAVQNSSAGVALPWVERRRRQLIRAVPALRSGVIGWLDRWDLASLVCCTVSLGLTCYIAVAQYSAQPHILDA